MQMTSRGVKNDFDEMLRSKREMESTAKALHIELQNALLLCSKMEEVGNFRFTSFDRFITWCCFLYFHSNK